MNEVMVLAQLFQGGVINIVLPFKIQNRFLHAIP